ncbi:universal stress protein [Kurthia massiliensis]
MTSRFSRYWSRGLNGLQQMMPGSVSHKVIKHVNYSILVVK